MTHRKSSMMAAITAATLMALAGCGGNGGDDTGGGESAAPLKIGVIGPLSGPLARGGEDHLRGYQLAVDEANANGGINGRKIELVPGDAVTPDQGITEARRLATQENVEVFVGTYSSGAGMTASETAARYKKLYWETNALANELSTRNLDNFVRVGTNADAYGEQSAVFIQEVAEQLGKPINQLRVFIEHEDSAYGTSIAARQEALLKEAGANVVGKSSHASTATDLTDAVLRARQARPDVWMFTGYPTDTHLVLNTAHSQGFRPPAIVLTGVGDTEETQDAVPAEYLNGIFVVGYPRPTEVPVSASFAPGVDAYIEAYEKKYGESPRTPPAFTAYAGMRVLIETIKKAGSTDPAAIREAVRQYDEQPGAMANGWGLKFDDNYQNTRTIATVIQWQDGKAVTVYPENAATGKATGLPLS